MNNTHNVINDLLVNIFNEILVIEQNALKMGVFSDVTITEVHTIEAIGLYDSKSMGEVAKMLGITVGTLTAAINNLVKKGYVERIRSQEDRRVVKISLTRRGKLLYRIHKKFHGDMVKATVTGLDEKEEAVLVHSLERLEEFLKEKYTLLSKGNKE
ncbi:MarR family transcriptional regulator [Clostridium polyendosporum]|uniref:MarR family transcriptional regulator n=1 Tax=Clostridium polyendosporum TaxID=69208 RepID=A0A919RXX2_9CLOT|nr:MarR family transcriptional regulator [Clostridium polyendosporum]GIM27475.1 MarR family transcriptional regulator [Clostridium polyendosporum]